MTLQTAQSLDWEVAGFWNHLAGSSWGCIHWTLSSSSQLAVILLQLGYICMIPEKKKIDKSTSLILLRFAQLVQYNLDIVKLKKKLILPHSRMTFVRCIEPNLCRPRSKTMMELMVMIVCFDKISGHRSPWKLSQWFEMDKKGAIIRQYMGYNQIVRKKLLIRLIFTLGSLSGLSEYRFPPTQLP